MNTDKIEIIGLTISAIILLGCLWLGVRIKSQYPTPEQQGVSIEQAIQEQGLGVDYTGLQRYERLESDYQEMRAIND